MAKTAWQALPCCMSELRLEHTLKCGQSFRWKEVSQGVWTGVIGHQVWRLRQNKTHLFYQVFHKDVESKSPSDSKVDRSMTDVVQKTRSDLHASLELKCQKVVNVQKGPFKVKMEYSVKEEVKEDFQKGNTDSGPVISVKQETDSNFDPNKENENILMNYFQLNVNLGKLYKSWSDSDANFKEISSSFEGIRMLRQDPVENLFSFICSSNNHISRISTMVEKLCDHYGDKITKVDGKIYHSFPRISSLASDGVEAQLRELGFGYRAKYINTTARYIMDNHSEEWLYSLRTIPYKDTKRELMKMCGVGAKVADCVCLMSMDKPGSVPVDTHVWQITARHYLTKLQHSKSLTEKLYEEIGDYFRNLWGEYAGWAHSVLFAADLKHFKDSNTKQSTKEISPVTSKRPAKKKSEDADKVKRVRKK